MPRRILLLITDLEIGGTPTVVRELAIRLRNPAGVEIEVACLARWGPVADELTAAGVGVTALGARKASDFPIALWRLVRLIRHGPRMQLPDGRAGEPIAYASQKLQFDTVFSFLVHANTLAAAARPFCPSVRFLQSIQTTQPEPEWHWRVQEFAQLAADRVAGPWGSVAQVARLRADVPRSRLVVIPNAIDVRTFDSIRVGRRSPTAPFQIGFIGRLDPIKRIDDLLKAIHGCGNERPFHLHLFGDGAARAGLEADVRRLHLAPHVTFHGAIARPHEALSQIDVLVLPSDAEGFGLVLIEAMAAGVPVVATNVPGIRDVVRPHQTGLLVPARDPRSLGAAIFALCTDDVLRDRIVAAARADVEVRFGWEVVLPQYRALLRLS